jgi:superfamily II DNA or RNA helicase
MVLTEGFDEPSLKTAWVRDSGKSCTIQMSGRAFRKHPLWRTNPEFRLKQVVQSKKTRWPMIRTAMPHQQLVWDEDRWLTLNVNPLINRINSNCRMAIVQTVVDMPKFILDKQVKKRR